MHVALGVRIAIAWASWMAAATAIAGPVLDVSRLDVSYGRTPQNFTTPLQPVWLANVGDAPLTIATIAITGSSAAQFAWSGTCAPSATLAPGERCRIDTTLTPVGLLPNLRAATLSVTTSASPTAVSISLSATLDNGSPQSPFQAVPIDPAPDWIDFGTQPAGSTSASQAIRIVNSGNLTFTWAALALTGGEAADFSATSPCVLGAPFAPGAECVVTIAFTPLAAGPRATELAVTATYFGVVGEYRYSVSGVGAGAVTPVVTPVVEYFNPGFGHYFMTAEADEIAGLDAGAYNFAFVRTGLGFNAWNATNAGTVPVCRFFTTPGTFGAKSSHFYTANAVECEGVKLNPAWVYEKIAFHTQVPAAGVCLAGTVPVYRMYNHGQTGAPNHRFTTDAAIYADFVATKGWDAEGIAFCAPA
jgi:hypothetical protein